MSRTVSAKATADAKARVTRKSTDRSRHYYYKPRVDWELLERHSDRLVALSGCLSGEAPRAVA